MDFKSTVFRSSPEKGSSKYNVECKRIPFNTEEGRDAVDPLLVREKAARRKHFLDRGHYEAKTTSQHQNGESGVWSVVDFTGRYHRSLIESDPEHTIPGHALKREDERIGGEQRFAALNEKFEDIEKRHSEAIKKTFRMQRSQQRLANQTSEVERSISANDALIEKRIMLADSLNFKQELLEREREAADRESGHKKNLRLVDTEHEVELWRSCKRGRESNVRRLLKIVNVNPVFIDPKTKTSPLHLAWDFWESVYEVKGAVGAIIQGM